MNPKSLHSKYTSIYLSNERLEEIIQAREKITGKTETDVLKSTHKFIRSGESSDTWENRVAKKYYEKLFKEYCLW
jgi:protein FRA10AC1